MNFTFSLSSALDLVRVVLNVAMAVYVGYQVDKKEYGNASMLSLITIVANMH